MNFYFDSTIIILLPALLLSFYAQSKIQSSYSKYSQIGTKTALTGAMVARQILDRNNLQNVVIEMVPGILSDHYDPRVKKLRLSQNVYYGKTIAANAIAAHEVGHAIQHDKSYFPLQFRNAIVPTVNIASQISMPLIMLGLFISSFNFLLNIGIILFSITVLFQIITLPVEFDASFRAMNNLKEENILVGEEINGGKNVLQAAALTYIAGTLTAVSQLIRLILISNRRDNRR